MKIAILGYGSQGASAQEYWNSDENDITVCDQNESLELPDGVQAQLGSSYLTGLAKFDLLVRSPSIHPQDIVLANPDAPDILNKVTTNTNEFLEVCPTKNVIGVTGTKGKGTTSTLIAEILKAAGKQVHLGGNIGTPPLEMLKENIKPTDWVVLELANFQLIDIKKSPHIAVCLMITSEHQDWHHNFDEYITAKQQLFRWQKADDYAIFFANSPHSHHIVSASKGQITPYFSPPGACIENDHIVIDTQVVCAANEVALRGKHNWQNVCAAITAIWPITQDIEAIRRVIKTFKGMEFRLEHIRTTGGIDYYNDSFGTTPETAIVALEAFNQPKVIILGGSDKGANFTELAKAVKANNVRSVVLIGQTGPAIKEALEAVDFTNIVAGGQTMEAIVGVAAEQAKAGDVVLLSTACASFDLFKNYKDRGEQFNQAVRALP